MFDPSKLEIGLDMKVSIGNYMVNEKIERCRMDQTPYMPLSIHKNTGLAGSIAWPGATDTILVE